MPAPLKFFINQSAQDPADALVASFFSTAQAIPMTLAEGDRGREVELHPLKENPNTSDRSQPFVYDDPTGWDVRFAAGTIKAPVSSGSWTFSDIGAGQTTAPIAYNASAAAVQAAIRAACTTNFLQAVVTGNPGRWTLDRGIPDPYGDAIAADTSGISPAGSVVEITNTQHGTTLLNETWDLVLVAAPAILRTRGWTALPAAAVSVSTVTEGGASVSEEQRVVWNSDAYAGRGTLSLELPHAIAITSSSVGNPAIITTEAEHGLVTGDSVTIAGHNGSTPSINSTYTVTRISATKFSIPVNVTVAGTGGALTATLTRAVGPVPYNASEEVFVELLEAHPASTTEPGSFGVTRNSAGDYTVSFKGALSNTAIAEMTATHSLKVPVGLRGTIDCLTAGVRRLLNGSRVPVTTNLEIEKTVAGVPTMIAFRSDLRLRPELISSSPGTSDPVQAFLQYNASMNTADLSDIAFALGATSIATANTPALAITGTGTGSSGVFTIATTNMDFVGLLLNFTHLGSSVMSLNNYGTLILGGDAAGVQFGTATGAPRLKLGASGSINLSGVPTSDPGVSGDLWIDGDTVKVST